MKNLIGVVMATLVTFSVFFFPQMACAQSGRGWMDGFVARESATDAAADAMVELIALAPRMLSSHGTQLPAMSFPVTSTYLSALDGLPSG
jgi:hypothetical protein